MRETKHDGAAFIFLCVFNNPTIYKIEYVIWTIKCLAAVQLTAVSLKLTAARTEILFTNPVQQDFLCV